jgi:hypothetical protein
MTADRAGRPACDWCGPACGHEHEQREQTTRFYSQQSEGDVGLCPACVASVREATIRIGGTSTADPRAQAD